jgi:hypothetical protein
MFFLVTPDTRRFNEYALEPTVFAFARPQLLSIALDDD